MIPVEAAGSVIDLDHHAVSCTPTHVARPTIRGGWTVQPTTAWLALGGTGLPVAVAPRMNLTGALSDDREVGRYGGIILLARTEASTAPDPRVSANGPMPPSTLGPQ